jgi:hypothetical protein
MDDARTEFIAVDRDIDWVRNRIAELERLASDPRHDASPSVVRVLIAEWQGRLRSLQERRESLLRSMCESDQ